MTPHVQPSGTTLDMWARFLAVAWIPPSTPRMSDLARDVAGDHRADHVRPQAQVDLGRDQLDVLSGHGQVASEREPEATRQGDAVDPGYDRLWMLGQRLQEGGQ